MIMAAAVRVELEHDLTTRPVLGLAPAPSPADLVRYEAEPTRCVIEAVLRNRGLALWRVRLRPIAVALTLPSELGRNPEVPSYATLTAQISARPRFASLPGTLGLFLPNTPREQRISLAALAIGPAFAGGTTVTSTAVVMLGARVWPVELAVETIHNDGERIIAAITGEIPREVPIPFARCAMHIDAAIEFRRWA
jgi:hypothetical protein